MENNKNSLMTERCYADDRKGHLSQISDPDKQSVDLYSDAASILNGISSTADYLQCGLLNSKWNTSYQEQYIKNVLQCIFPDLREQVRIPGTRMSFDMYIPSEKLVIEYGSSWYHAADRSSDVFKRELCENIGIGILFILQDKDVSARGSGKYFDGAIRIANRNKVDQKKFIDPIIDKICSFYGKEYDLAMVDRNLCSRKALENQKHVR